MRLLVAPERQLLAQQGELRVHRVEAAAVQVLHLGEDRAQERLRPITRHAHRQRTLHAVPDELL
ncbi:MAG TPA: hypothetical protein VEY92_11965 [Pseudoxanthomonas sp.]|nr:hypothetical protein [Pseudoxanthomonas sp.]